MTTRFASGREILVGRGIPQPIPITLAPAAYAGAFAYGEDNVMYYCDGSAWIHADGRRPRRVVSSAYTAVLADAGRVVSIATGGVTIPAGVFSAGHKFSILNNSAVSQDVVPAAGVTLYLGGAAAAGPRTLGPRGLVDVECIGTNSFVMSGTGLVTPNPEGVTLVAPNFFSAPLTLERAQLAGVQSSAINGTDNGLTFYDADVPRFTGSAQRLLIEGQRTNGFGNPRLEDAVAGSPGIPPTTTGVSFLQGLSSEIVGTGVEDNIPYIDLRFFGTATGGEGSRYLLFNAPTNGLDISNNKVSTFSAYVKLQGGSLDQISNVRLNLAGRDASNVEVPFQGAQTYFTPTNAALGEQRRVVTWTPSDLSVLYGAWAVDILRGATATVDVTLRIGLPQHELGAFASSPILPPVGTPGASTRGDDRATALLNALGISGNGTCTVLWSGVIPAFLPGGIHTIACVDDASVLNRLTMRLDQASGQLQAMRALNGAVATANAGAVTAGIAFKAGMTVNGAGRVAVSLNGGAAVNVTGGPSSGFTRFRLGNIADQSTPLWGETARLRVLPYVVSDAELAVLTGALP